ncbi:MAG: rhomboid family intramembrane serine protease, partial [Gemmatimonadaceae bacterium]
GDGGRVDFEDGMTYAPRATLLLIVTLAAVFAWEIANRALASRQAIVAAGALVRQRVLDGELWRLGSATFLHGGMEHLVGNCVSLYILGMACEHAVGARRMLTLFAAGAIGGWALSLAMAPGPSVGASGAIFGVMGAVVVILHRHRDLFVVRDKRIGVVVAVWAGYTLLLGALQPMIDNAAHLGGLLAGAGAAFGLPVREYFRRERLRRAPVGTRRVR